VRCHYADDPNARPQCTLTAVVRYGNVALCSSCQARRSTLGKGQRPLPLATSPALDVLDWVTTAHQQANDADRALAAAVTRARQAGHPWSAIGTRLGVSRQAAQQRFAAPNPTQATRALPREATKGPTRAS
jgi:hypothetical protein